MKLEKTNQLCKDTSEKTPFHYTGNQASHVIRSLVVEFCFLGCSSLFLEL
jgi:hypothetical protein